MRNSVILLISFILLLSPLSADEKFEFWPGASYDAAVPTLEKIVGHKSGERITTPADIVKYLEALAAAKPSQMKVWEYGRTWENRPLVYAVVGSEANIRRLSEIQAGIKALTDPRQTSQAEADKLIASLPALVWLAYGVHGNEISSPDAALMTAYHLLAAKNEDVTKTILKDALVIIDPLQNPDGRNRFVNHFVQSEGLLPNANPEAIEHTEAWPGGRTNHYLFDMNRDWFALTQPETRGRIKVLQEWFPQVFVDLHEMGGNSTYYFAPEAIPYNPHLVKDQREALDWFGQNNAKWFDHYGISYFTREVFDAFYPGYGASWPNYWGSVAMTYEQASSRGLVMRRSVDGVTFHFRQTVKQHFIASLSTAEATAKHREQLLKNFYAYNVSAIEEGKTDEVQAFALPRTGDVSAVDKLADLLAVQGIEVQRTKSAMVVGDKDCPAGSYVINLAQPKKRLIRTLLDPDVPMEEDFVKEQERKRSKNLPDNIYDVVGWSLPLMYNVEMASSTKPVTGDFETVPGGKLPEGKVEGGQASVAYLVPWGTRAAGRLLTAALLKDLTVWTADKKFELNGHRFSRGTLIFKVADNDASIHSVITELAKTSGADVFASNTAYVVKGISLGSNYVIPMKKPTIAIAWDEPTASYSAGTTRFVIERQFGYPTTPIRTRNLAGSADLDRFDVLILPSTRSGYAKAVGEAGMARLKSWVRAGGTLIALSGAVADLADPKVDLLSISREYQPREDEKKTAAKKEEKREARVPGKLIEKEEDWKKAIEPKKESPDSVAGVLALANLDPDNWVTAGIAESVNVMVQGKNIYTPITLDKGVNAAVFAGPDELLKSGYMWDENRKQTAYKPFIVVQRTGKGYTVGFTADPNYRAYMDGLNILFLNSIFRSQTDARTRGMMAAETEW
jgi:zinc carboxypeptidase